MALIIGLVIVVWLIKSLMWWWTAFKLKYGLAIIKIKWWLTTIIVAMFLLYVFKWWILVLLI